MKEIGWPHNGFFFLFLRSFLFSSQLTRPTVGRSVGQVNPVSQPRFVMLDKSIMSVNSLTSVSTCIFGRHPNILLLLALCLSTVCFLPFAFASLPAWVPMCVRAACKRKYWFACLPTYVRACACGRLACARTVSVEVKPVNNSNTFAENCHKII